ncbi:hypothetical protein Taro_052988 [Colocasia esculenta]|uniref:Uncharacterized protein n=1 Tax=Colocasia esculenta TaxID=4460 RepID=A0A843XL94_COLES|nr:hypothetical protein [Colocasia esculenta]
MCSVVESLYSVVESLYTVFESLYSGDIAPSRSIFIEELASPSIEVDIAAIEAGPPAPNWMDLLMAYLLRSELLSDEGEALKIRLRSHRLQLSVNNKLLEVPRLGLRRAGSAAGRRWCLSSAVAVRFGVEAAGDGGAMNGACGLLAGRPKIEAPGSLRRPGPDAVLRGELLCKCSWAEVCAEVAAKPGRWRRCAMVPCACGSDTEVRLVRWAVWCYRAAEVASWARPDLGGKGNAKQLA